MTKTQRAAVRALAALEKARERCREVIRLADAEGRPNEAWDFARAADAVGSAIVHARTHAPR